MLGGHVVDDTDADAHFPSAVALIIPHTRGSRDAGFCSGTLISPSHVLTAAHCLTALDTHSAVPIRVLFGALAAHLVPPVCTTGCPWTFEASSTTLAQSLVARCEINPGFYSSPTGLCDGTEFTDSYWELHEQDDFAVLTLAAPVPRSWATGRFGTDPHRLVDGDDGPVGVGATVTVVGYGLTTLTDPPGGLGRRRFLPTSIDTLEGGVLLIDASLATGGTLPGDSGGPSVWPGAEARPYLHEPVVAVTGGGSPGGLGYISASLISGPAHDWVQSRLDADGDGRWDMLCPFPGPGTSPLSTPPTDADGDGLLDEEDLCPHVYDPCQQTDRDHDGVGDACDTCPDVRNPGPAQTLDTDGDGRVDACDNCPTVSNPGWDDVDVVEEFAPIIGDGVGNACDNCPFVLNAGQENCNVDAEKHRPASLGGPLYNDDPTRGPLLFGIGDACDPIPCGDTRLGASTRRVDLLTNRVSMDRVEVDALSTLSQDARTGFRACPCSAADRDELQARDTCIRVQADLTGGCAIPANEIYDSISEDRRWRDTTFDHSAPAADLLTTSPHRQEVVLSYGARAGAFTEDLASTWRLQDLDKPRWVGSFGDVYPRDPTGRELPLPIVLWTATPGRRTFDFALATRALASHYWSGPVDAPFDARVPFPCHNFIGPLVERGPCLACDGSFPAGFLALPSLLVRPGLCAPPIDTPVLVFPNYGRDPAIAFGANPATELGGEKRWVTVAEAAPFLSETGLRYVALSPDGFSIARMLVATPNGLATPSKPPPPPCDNRPQCNAPMLTAATVPTDWIATASARRDVVWIAHAMDPPAELTLLDVVTGDTRLLALPSDLSLGRVLALSYAAGTDELLVLDELADASGGAQARLLAVAPLGGDGRELARWPRIARATHFAMASDPDDGVWIASSFDGPSPHVVVRLDRRRRGLPLLGFAVGAGAVEHGMMRASDVGASLAVHGPLGDRVVGYRSDSLVPRGRGWERCF